MKKFEYREPEFKVISAPKEDVLTTSNVEGINFNQTGISAGSSSFVSNKVGGFGL